MSTIPKDPWPDSTIQLLRQGNCFISNTCKKLNTPIFETRLLLRKTICMRGREHAVLFYDQSKFSRKGAAPLRLQKTLTGKEGVQGLDGVAHQRRKAAFMSLMSAENINRLSMIFERQWMASASKWQKSDAVCLYDAANEVCFRAACEWSGILLEHTDVAKRTEEMVAMIESPAAIGPKHLKGILARKSAEQWARQLIEVTRRHPPKTDTDRALAVLALLKNPDGHYLDEKAAAVDLLNVIRPIVAIGRYICFAALSLHHHPQYRRQLENGTESDFLNFVQEVRRFYPYFPFSAAVVKEGFSWQGFKFEKGSRVLLDLFGTNRDPELWDAPNEFNPDRFIDRQDDAFDFIPQGGGNYANNHRCAGEWITIEIVKCSLKLLVRAMSYKVPDQNLTVDFTKMPTLPNSGLILTDISLKPYTPEFRQKAPSGHHDEHLDSQEAKAGAPSDTAVCGEEDPGAGLEDFVNELDNEKA